MKKLLECLPKSWRIRAGGIQLDLDRQTGVPTAVTLHGTKPFTWTEHPADLIVRDDLLRKRFDRRDIGSVSFSRRGDALTIRRTFRGAPWIMVETYTAETDALRWESEIQLGKGDFRSCAVSYRLPLPSPVMQVALWGARENMPTLVREHSEIAFEYAERWSGILMPAISAYLESANAGLVLAMPFDFRTPRLRFISSFREEFMEAQFDWMALRPGHPARTCLLLRATPGDWRPALGWLYERFQDYFEPRSQLIHRLWGGHVCSSPFLSLKDARIMTRLGLKWYEIHGHFPAYGDYFPEGLERWISDEKDMMKDMPLVSADAVRKTIRTLHGVGAAAMPYLQVTGDGDTATVAKTFAESQTRDVRGRAPSCYRRTVLMNSDPSLPFGRSMRRQIVGLLQRYPECDGVFLDQPCYNFQDTAHDDGISAFENRPCYMTGFSYYPHLEHLSALLHPRKAIISNAPFSVGILKYIDGFMAEANLSICDHLQYYGLAKPMYFLCYHTGDRDIEAMFQACLLRAACFTSYPKAARSIGLYRQYVPLLERLYHRRWVFDPSPLNLPTKCLGQIYRGRTGSLLLPVVSQMSRVPGRALPDLSVQVRTRDADGVRKVTCQRPGGRIERIRFGHDNSAVQFDLPDRMGPALMELHLR